jgi:hypothetical protein
LGKNTIDLQLKIRANYNATLRTDLRNAAGAKTMANNGKNNAQSNRNSASDWTPEGRGRRCARAAPTGM